MLAAVCTVPKSSASHDELLEDWVRACDPWCVRAMLSARQTDPAKARINLFTLQAKCPESDAIVKILLADGRADPAHPRGGDPLVCAVQLDRPDALRPLLADRRLDATTPGRGVLFDAVRLASTTCLRLLLEVPRRYAQEDVTEAAHEALRLHRDGHLVMLAPRVHWPSVSVVRVLGALRGSPACRAVLSVSGSFRYHFQATPDVVAAVGGFGAV